MIRDELLDHRQWLRLELLSGLRNDLCDISQVVDPDVLIADVLENFPRDFSELVALRVDEVAKVAAGAASLPVVIPAGNRAIVPWVDKLVRVWGRD